MKIGIIKRIDIKNTISKPNNNTNTNTNTNPNTNTNIRTRNRCAFIHFNKWFEHGNGLIARERLLNGKDIKVIYDEPWFWKITAARNQSGT